MKLSSALVLLALGAADARHAGAGTRRRAQTEATDSELDDIVADNAGGNRRCKFEELSGLVHISATTSGMGGFAIMYNSDRETVKHVGPSGSTFDFESCEEFTFCRPGRRMLMEDDKRMLLEDNVGADSHKSEVCQGKDTILFCPLISGQRATFRITDSLRVCTGPIRKLQDDEVDEDQQDTLAGLFLWVSTPEIYGEFLSAQGDQGSANETPTAQCDLVATLQCGPKPASEQGLPIPRQDSECAYGSSNVGNRVHRSQLGNQYVLNLRTCVVRERGTLPN
jgi:hypothetical protein